MVEYENGDPDRPIIVGSVYNGTSENPGNLVSLSLPEKKTMSGVLGKSSTDGGSTIHNANAWWFDDAKGSEQFLVRARKDLYFRAYNNQNIRVSANVTETVGGNETINVGPDAPWVFETTLAEGLLYERRLIHSAFATDDHI